MSRNPQSRRQAEPPEKSGFRKLFAPILAVLAATFKFAAPVLKFLPIVLKGGGILTSFALYAWSGGWLFGAGAITLLFVHEMGHYLAAKYFGLKTSLPMFIPFMGAAIVLRDLPRNAWMESLIGIAGPLAGTLGGLVCYVIGLLTGNPVFFALAGWSFFLNLFNLVPIVPLDGGRAVSAISPWLWIIGLGLLVPYLVWNISLAGGFILLLVASSVPRVWGLFRARNDPESQSYFQCEPWQRGMMTFMYFGLVLFLAVAMTESHHILAAL